MSATQKYAASREAQTPPSPVHFSAGRPERSLMRPPPRSASKPIELVSEAVGLCQAILILQAGSVVTASPDRGEVNLTDLFGRTTILARMDGAPQGLAADRHGGLYLLTHGGNRLMTVKGCDGLYYLDRGGQISQLLSGFGAPHDLAFGPDGLLYICDAARQDSCAAGRIWRYNPDTGECHLWMRVGFRCTGIGFGLEGDRIYIADGGGRRIVTVPLCAPEEHRVTTVVRALDGAPARFVFDVAGRLLIATGGGSDGARGGLELHDPVEVLGHPLCCGLDEDITALALSAAGQVFMTDAGLGRLLRWSYGVPGLPLYPFR